MLKDSIEVTLRQAKLALKEVQEQGNHSLALRISNEIRNLEIQLFILGGI